MIQSHDFSGPVTNIAASGTFLLYAAAPTAALGISDRVQLFIDGMNAGQIGLGDWIELQDSASRWEIRPVNPQASGVMTIGDAKVGTARTLGTVEVVDGGVKSSLAGLEFIVAVGTGGVAAQNPFQCLSNFATGVRIAVRRARISGQNSCRFQLRQTQINQSTPGTPLNSALAQNKNLGTQIAGLGGFGWAEAAETPAQVSVLPVPLVGAHQVASGALDFAFDPPLIVGPNEGLVWSSNLQNNTLWASWEGTLVS